MVVAEEVPYSAAKAQALTEVSQNSDKVHSHAGLPSFPVGNNEHWHRNDSGSVHLVDGRLHFVCLSWTSVLGSGDLVHGHEHHDAIPGCWTPEALHGHCPAGTYSP